LSNTTNETPDTFPEFDAAAVRAEIQDYSPDRAMGEPAPGRAMASGAAPTFLLSMLAPEDRGEIPQRLAAIADPAERARMETKLVEPVVRKLAHSANIRRGHPNGTAYDQAVAQVTNQVWSLQDEDDRIAADMAKVIRYDTAIDPKTGQPSHTPVYALSGRARDIAAQRRVDIVKHVFALEGPEGKLRLERAAEEELAKRAEQHESARILTLADKRSREIVAEERIEELARAKAARLRNQL
jgi:hypothetical protein